MVVSNHMIVNTPNRSIWRSP